MKGALSKFGTAAGRWAGVGPYYAMFPASFTDRVVAEHTTAGDAVLDPFAGRGTAVFSAAVAGRLGIGIELNPVGWIYSKTKLSPACREEVESRIEHLQATSPRFRKRATELPAFFRHCYSKDVREFLVSARSQLDWRNTNVDRTTMAFLLIHLHGKSSDSLSNQMRQTKAMAPNYAVNWWKQRQMRPPEVDPAEFFRKKCQWRYAHGAPCLTSSKVYLGDSTKLLPSLTGDLTRRKLRRASLLLTSPPYFGITNYHYDQWLRLWLLGGAPNDHRTATLYAGKHRGKFANTLIYRRLIESVFSKAVPLLKSDATIYVRTDKREPTLGITKAALKSAFPDHRLTRVDRPVSGETQTRLFGHDDPRIGEVDLIMYSTS